MKKKIIYILVVLSVLLLLTNLIMNLSTQKKTIDEGKPEANTNLIDSLFLQTIAMFNLDESWIKKVPISSRAYDSLNYVYRITLPGDLRPAVVLFQINKTYTNLPVELISDEKIVNSNTTLNIFSNDILKLQASFQVKSELIREHASFSFIINNFSKLNEEKIEKIFRSTLPLNILLKPSAQSDSLIRKISSNKKTYSILIDDEIDGDSYLLKPELSKKRLRESIRYISWNFPDAQLYIINDKSKIFNSAVYNFVRDEFNTRNIELLPLTNFINISSDYDEAVSLLKFYLESGIGKQGKFVIIPGDTFSRLESIFLVNKLRGTKFYSPSEMMRINSEMKVAN
ncbi:MAG TPA: hypothetical protein ENN33_03350 [Ignavibacteria bacterium]|nr:hypothetical protein [Ignavibacteria bacterium]